MTGMDLPATVREWVRPSPVEVEDLQWLAHRRRVETDGIESDAAAAMVATVMWVWGRIPGPATGRLEQPVTRAVAVAEWWAAAAVSDGGATSERQRRGVCAELGVAYWSPQYDRVGLEEGYAIYQTLSWLLGTLDGWERGRRPPLTIPVRNADGDPAASDQRSRELAELIGQTRRRAVLTQPSSSSAVSRRL
ncbi:MAG: hypothetical protein ABR608_12485 [Pseudonocardiaceae bacterium]